MKLNVFAIMLIILLAFMSLGAASAMEDGSLISLDDSSNASDLTLGDSNEDSNLHSICEDNDLDLKSIEDNDDLDSASGDCDDLDSASGDCDDLDSASEDCDDLDSASGDCLDSLSNRLSSSNSNELSASEIVIYEKDYNSYFSSDGKAKSSINKEGNIIKLAGSFKNKTFIFTVPLTVTGYSSDTRLYDCVVSFAEGSGSPSSYARVCGLNIYSNASGAYQRPCIYINEFDYAMVYDNTLYNTGVSSYGIYIYYSSHCNVTGNKVQTRVGNGGCWQHAGICLTGSHFNCIASNDVSVEDSNGIYLSSYNGAKSNSNIIFNNTVRCTLSESNPSVTGLTQPSAWCYMIHTMGDDNTITNNTVSNGFVGVYAEGSYNKITGNHISGLHGAYFEGSTENEGGETAIYSKACSYVANNTVINCSILSGRIAGGIQVDSNSQVLDNYVQIANDGYAMYVASNCTISRNTLISLGGGIDAPRENNYNNTISFNNISCLNGYNIKITASGNLVENNTLINAASDDGTRISAVYLYGKQAMDKNRIVNNTIITNTAFAAYLQGNASNTLIACNHISTNNSNPFYERKYGNGASNAQYPVNTTILNNDLELPVVEVNITDESYSSYFEDNGYLINGALIEESGLQTVLVISNIANKKMIFNSRVAIDGQSLGNITNCTISFESGSSGSKVENLVMSYVHDGESAVNLISVGRDVSNLTISNNDLFVVSLSESISSVKVISIENGGNSNIDIANNMISIEAGDSNIFGICMGPADNVYILNNEIDISGFSKASGIFLNGLNDSKIESNAISSKSSGDLSSSNAYGIEGYDVNGIEILGNSFDIESELLSYGMSLNNPQNMAVHDNSIHAMGCAAVGIDLTGSAGGSLDIYENTVKITGGDFSDIHAIGTVGNYLVSIADDLDACVYDNAFIVSNSNPLNADESKLNQNRFLVNEETIDVLFDSADGIRTISPYSNIKSGDILVFDSLGNAAFVLDIPLTVKSSDDDVVLRNIEFDLTGVSGFTFDHVILNNSLGGSAISIRESSNVLLDGVIIEGDCTGVSIINSDNVSMIYSTVNITSSDIACLVKSSNSSGLDISNNRLEARSKAAYAILGEDIADSLFKSNAISIEGSGREEGANLNVPQAGICLNGTSSNIAICDNEIRSAYESGGDYAIALDLNAQSRNISLSGNDLASNNSLSLGIWAIYLSGDVDEISNMIVISSTAPVDKTVTMFEFANISSILPIVSSDGSRTLGGVFKFRLSTVDGDALAGRHVALSFKGENYDLVTDEEGYANITLSYDYGYSGPISLEYYGEYPLYGAGDMAFVAAPKLQTAISASNMNTLTLVNAAYNTGSYYKFYLRDVNGKAIGGKAVRAVLDGRTYYVKTDSKGMAKLQANLKTAKTYEIKLYFAGDGYYSASSASARIKAVKNRVVIKASSVKIKRSKAGRFYVKATFKSRSGKALIRKAVKLYVNGRTFKAKTNKKGLARFKVKLPKRSKTYKFKVKFAGDKQNYAKAASAKIKVR